MNTKIIFAERDFKAAVMEAAETIRQGDIVVLPTETVYGLAANAFDVDAVRKIFTAKGRPQDNPLIVHIADQSMLQQLTEDIPPSAQKLMDAFWPGPLSLVMHKNESIPDEVSAGLDTVAVRMPDNEIFREIIRRAGVPIAAPSANTSGKPSPTLAQHAFEDLGGRVPLIIDGGPCAVGVESTVVDITKEVPVILRPGGITPGEIRDALQEDVKLHPGAVGNTVFSGKAASPGMRYRHYAPRARVHVFSGDKKTIEKNIVSLYHLYKENGQNPVIFCTDHFAEDYGNRNITTLGDSAKQTEAALFRELRAADDAGADAILFHLTDDMGLAVKNRITKAAEPTAGEE